MVTTVHFLIFMFLNGPFLQRLMQIWSGDTNYFYHWMLLVKDFQHCHTRAYSKCNDVYSVCWSCYLTHKSRFLSLDQPPSCYFFFWASGVDYFFFVFKRFPLIKLRFCNSFQSRKSLWWRTDAARLFSIVCFTSTYLSLKIALSMTSLDSSARKSSNLTVLLPTLEVKFSTWLKFTIVPHPSHWRDVWSHSVVFHRFNWHKFDVKMLSCNLIYWRYLCVLIT